MVEWLGDNKAKVKVGSRFYVVRQAVVIVRRVGRIGQWRQVLVGIWRGSKFKLILPGVVWSKVKSGVLESMWRYFQRLVGEAFARQWLEMALFVSR